MCIYLCFLCVEISRYIVAGDKDQLYHIVGG